MDNSSKHYTVQVNQIDKLQWEQMLLEFDDATIYQTWSYGAVRWGQNQLSHIVIKQDDLIVAAAQLRIIKLPLIKAGIAYLPWGPLWRRKNSQKNIDVFRNILTALKEEYAIKQGLLLRIHPNIPDEENQDLTLILKETGFQKDQNVKPYRTLILDLSPTMAELRKSLDQKWRNQLNRSEKNNLCVIEGNDDDLYQIFQSLQAEMYDRKKYTPGVDYEEFRQIQQDLPEKLKMHILITEFEGKALTATIGSLIGDTGIYLLGATGNAGMQMKGAYLLQWRFIEKMKAYGCKRYDLGGIDPQENPGVYHFKSGITPKEVFHIGQFEICDSITSSFFVKGAEKLKKIVATKKIKYISE